MRHPLEQTHDCVADVVAEAVAGRHAVPGEVPTAHSSIPSPISEALPSTVPAVFPPTRKTVLSPMGPFCANGGAWTCGPGCTLLGGCAEQPAFGLYAE